MRRLEFRILGSCEVALDGRLLALGRSRQRALLAALLVHANEVVPTERLVDELWGDDAPETAPKMIQNYVSRLRRLLEPEDVLQTEAGGYVLRLGPDELDARRFERLVTDGRRALADGRTAAAAETLREALALWRGAPLAEFAYAPFAQTEIGRLEELRLAAVEDRVEADLALGRHGDVVGELEALVAENPVRERLRAHLMLALYRSGRQAEALATYQRTRQLLVDELGIEPSPALQRLERAILRQDATLEAPPPPAPAAAPPPAPAAPPPAQTRKRVSVLYAAPAVDGELDPEALRRVGERVLDAAEVAVRRHGGSVERLPSGELLSLFGVPELHEDDALRALRAASDVRDALAELNEELERDWRVRSSVASGVATGEVVVDERGPAGAAVGTAARLQRRTPPGGIALCDETERVVREAVTVEREGGDFRLVDLTADAIPIARRFDLPMIGRESELAQLRQSFERARDRSAPYLFTVLGPAGVGKSRLAAELAASLEGEAAVLGGRCLPYGEGITFWPLAEVVRQAAGSGSPAAIARLLTDDPDGALVAERLAGAIGGTGNAGTTDETFWAARRLFEALARERPLVLVLEDLHWAEPTFLDLLGHVTDWMREGPVLIVCLARPELLDAAPAWGGGKLNAGAVLLEPLSPHESELLLANLPAAREVPAEARSRIAEAAEGNPLFLEQMAAMLVERGGDEDLVPPTIQALLAARVDRLPPEERALLGRAAVEGKEFRRDAVVHLAPEHARAAVDSHLQQLVRRDLVRAGRAAGSFRFRHILIREAAYELLPREARAELHERFASWLEEREAHRLREIEEIVGYHLEQAYAHRTQLGPLDDDARRLAARAAERLAAAGRRAYARVDVPAAVALLSRAAELAGADGDGRLELLTDLAEALQETGEFRRAESVLDEVVAAAGAAGAAAVEAHARVLALRLRSQVDPDFTPDDLQRGADQAIAVLEEAGDERRLAKAWLVLAWAPWLEGRVADAERALEHAIAHAGRAGDARVEAQSLNLYLGTAFWGPLPVPDGIRRCREVLARGPDQQRLAASASRALAGLLAMQGDFAEARRLVAQDRAILEGLGLRVAAAAAADIYGLVELLAGDPAAAERELRRGCETLESMGERSSLPNLVAMLAQALHEQGRDDEALEATLAAEQATARDDLSGQVQWRAARAKALARLRRAGEGEALAREAVELAAGTPDFLILQADALVDLAQVLRLGGRGEEAATAAVRALELYERKGNVVSARRARALAGG